jgi:hypothetical protein
METYLPMTFEEMKAAWDKIEVPAISNEEMLKMTRVSNDPHVRRMRFVLLWQTIAAIAGVGYVFVVANLLTAPVWLTSGFILGVFAYLFTDYLGYRWLVYLPAQGNVKQGIESFLRRMKILVFLSRLTTAWLGAAIIGMMVLRVPIADNVMIWIVMVTPVLFITWLASRKWAGRVEETKRLLKEYES